MDRLKKLRTRRIRRARKPFLRSHTEILAYLLPIYSPLQCYISGNALYIATICAGCISFHWKIWIACQPVMCENDEVKAYFINAEDPAVTTVTLYQQDFKYEVQTYGIGKAI